MSERIYVGIILFKDGWHKMFTDGNGHYTYEPFVEEETPAYSKEKRNV